MGMFSWLTSDTKKSISNIHSERATFPVIMFDNKMNYYYEDKYEGYGVFGGKDYFNLVAEMNGFESTRENGLGIVFGEIELPFLSLPKFVEPKSVQKLINKGVNFYSKFSQSEICEYQGFFYENDYSSQSDESKVESIEIFINNTIGKVSRLISQDIKIGDIHYWMDNDKMFVSIRFERQSREDSVNDEKRIIEGELWFREQSDGFFVIDISHNYFVKMNIKNLLIALLTRSNEFLQSVES
jgi:hypothetical protein